jgi:hypothetical protein
VTWSAALYRQGKVPGLSNWQGHEIPTATATRERSIPAIGVGRLSHLSQPRERFNTGSLGTNHYRPLIERERDETE